MTETPEDAIPHPDDSDMTEGSVDVLLIGGGSGHGFKHGPEVGRYAAARLFGSVAPEPRFSLATKAETHKREVH